MKKRIFLLLYVIIFLAIPICVFHFQSIPEAEQSFGEPEIGDTLLMPDSTPVVVGENFTDTLNKYGPEGVIYSSPGEDFGQFETYHLENCRTVGFFCLLVSLLLNLCFSVYYFFNPLKKLGGIITTILIFNFFYLPVVMSIASFDIGNIGAYFFYMIPGFIENVDNGLAITISLLLIFLLTIILAIMASRKHTRLKKEL